MSIYTFTASRAVPITPSDTVGFQECDRIFVGGAGVVPVVFTDGSVVNFTCPAGIVLPVAAVRVNATNATATNLIALY